MVTKDSAASYHSFTQRKNTAVPVRISSCLNSSSGTMFLNNASKVESAFPHECSFKSQSAADNATAINEILNCSQGSFTAQGKLSWTGGEKTIESLQRNVREAVISDKTGSIPLSIWDDHFAKFDSNHSFYKLTHMKLRHFNGKTLSSQQYTEISKVKPFDVIEVEIEHEKICCPSILNATINVYPDEFFHLLRNEV